MSSWRDRIPARAIGAELVAPLSSNARTRRWQRFSERFPQIGEMTVLDLGGDARAWRASPVRPAHVTLVNLIPQQPEESWMSAIAGDACALPDDLPHADVVYSNSVIEHVGGHWRRQRFAENVRAAAPRYWVQTPYRYFPLEPHFLLPGLQFLPRAAQAKLVERWHLVHGSRSVDRDDALGRVLDIELLTRTELQSYFPDATLERERFGGLVKSLIAVR